MIQTPREHGVKPILSKLAKLEGTFYDKSQLRDHFVQVNGNNEPAPENHGKVWNDEDTAVLVLGIWCRLASVDIAKILKRKRSALYGRLQRIGIAELTGNTPEGWEGYQVTMSKARAWLGNFVIRDGAFWHSWEHVRDDIRSGKFYEERVPPHLCSNDMLDAFKTQLALGRPSWQSDPYNQCTVRGYNESSPFVMRVDDIDREVLTTLKNKEQIAMSVPMIDCNIPVTKLTVVYGQELKSTPPATMLELIKRAENQIADYKKMNVKSVFIEQEVKAREEAIALLVTELDSRVK